MRFHAVADDLAGDCLCSEAGNLERTDKVGDENEELGTELRQVSERSGWPAYLLSQCLRKWCRRNRYEQLYNLTSHS